jgi:hypothetical protein
LLEISEPYTDEDHIRIKTIGNVQILEIELHEEGGYIERLKRKGWI